jgi:XTP/dITP diphosphohydrolase
MLENHNAVVIATRNAGKVREFAALLGMRQLEVRSMADYEGLPEIIEDGLTFGANALIKAKAIADVLGIPVLADDSGLCVDALGGAPGVWSARYAGEGATDEANNAKLLLELGADKPAGNILEQPILLSKGQFVCALALYDPSRDEALQVEALCEGYIISEPRGHNGFGYDPLFYIEEYGLTMAELSSELKNTISHRAKALHALMQSLDA